MPRYRFALTIALGLAAPAAVAAPFDGLTSTTAGLSAAQILASFPGSPSGVYWVDPDGAGANAPFQVYADMTTAGGGWMLMRRTPATGNWFPFNDNLAGIASLNSGSFTNPTSTVAWSQPFATLGVTMDQFLFRTGNGARWGVLSATDARANSDTQSPNVTVIASSGTAVTAGNQTNVLNRPSINEDPWIGFEGHHALNSAAMLYGELTSLYTAYKNANGGVNVFVREVPAFTIAAPAAVPEPASAALFGLALAGLAALRRRA